MENRKRGQVGIEYLIVVGFVTFAIMSIIALAFIYSNQIKDRIKLNQVESFAVQVVNSAESVFFSGEPSKTTIRLYLPEGVDDINVTSDSLRITTKISSGDNVREFKSRVPLSGSITSSEGTKKLILTAHENFVDIQMD